MSEKTQNNFKKIDERTFEFALLIIELYRYLIVNNEYVMSKQILRSGTSIGANVQEAQAAQSKKDFVKKDEIFSENVAIINILTRIVKTSTEGI